MSGSYPIGAYPLGGFGDSLSVGDPLIGLITDPSIRREFLLRASPFLRPVLNVSTTASTSYADFGDVLDKGATDSFTVEILFALSTSGSNNMLVSKGSTTVGVPHWRMNFNTSNQLTVRLEDTVGVSVQPFLPTTTALRDGKLHRASFVVDRTTGYLLVYIDGDLWGRTALGSLGSLANASTIRVGYGCGLGSTARFADFRIWPYARTAEQVKGAALRRLSYEEGLGCDLYVPMDEGVDRTIYDASGNNRHGTLGSTAVWNESELWPVDLSSSGFTPLTSETPYKLFPGCIAKPYNFAASLPQPELMGGSSLGVGDLKINNIEGYRDHDSLHDWLGADADVYVGPKGGALSQFTRFFRGTSAGVSRSFDSFSILHRDLRFKLQKRLQSNRYMGMGACLRLDGTPDAISYGDILDKGATDSFTVEILFRCTSSIAASGALVAKMAGINNNTFAGWSIWRNVTDPTLLFIDIGDGTVAHFVEVGYNLGAYFDSKLHRLSMVIDRTAQLMRVYVDGTLITSTGGYSAIVISAVGSMTNAEPLYVGRSSAGNYFVGDVDDFRMWSYARTQAQIQTDMHRELAGSEAGLDLYTPYNEGTGTTANDSTANNHDGTIASSHWIGSLEGDASIAGLPKPLVFGLRRQISPRCVDPQNLVYQIHDGPIEEILAVRMAGDPLSAGTPRTDIYAGGPAAGFYDYDLTHGFIRLQSALEGGDTAWLTVEVKGDKTGGTYVANAADIHRRIAATYGGLTDPTDFDTASYTALKAKTTAVCGFYFSDDINVDEALDQVMKEGCCGWWSPTRLAKVMVGRIDDPAASTPEVWLTQGSLVDPAQGGTFSEKQIGVRVGRVVLGYRPYSTVLSPEDIAGTVDPEQGVDYGREHRYIAIADPRRSASTDTLTVLTTIDTYADALAETIRLLYLWNVDRYVCTVSLDQGVLSYFIGTPMRLLYPRYDYSTGKPVIAIGIAEDMGEYAMTDKLEVQLFG